MTLACAHRGDVARARENTLEAIRSAIAAGADIVEIDVRQSRDGTVIVLHDATLERLWGHSVAASEVPLQEILSLGHGDLRIPTLQDVVALFHGAAATLMVDMDTIEMADPAFDVVAASGLDVIWCGDLQAMHRIRSRSATARIWMPWASPTPPSIDTVRDLRPEAVNSPYHVLHRPFVEAVHAMGLLVSAWTVDDIPAMRWARAIGIDSVTTNALDRLQTVLAEEPTTEPELERPLTVAQELARWASQVIRHSAPGEVETKAHPADLVTGTDRLIETHIREVIAANLPGHVVVGEEFGGQATPGTPTWYVDPVDGTTNFANAVPWNSCSIALSIGGEPVIGVIADPWRHAVYWAVRGGGAFRNGAPLRVTPRRDAGLAGSVVLTELAAHRAWPGMIGFLDRLADAHATPRILGSGTLALASVATMGALGAVVHRFSPIDHLAAVLIASEAGAIVLDEAGCVTHFPTDGGVLVALPEAASTLHAIWRAAVTS